LSSTNRISGVFRGGGETFLMLTQARLTDP
jgi:hypothetical protein